MRSIICAAAVVALFLLQTEAEDRLRSTGFQLIVHPSVAIRTLSRQRVADIFLKQQTTWQDGTRVLPVDQPIRSSVRARFVRIIFRKDSRFIARYWHRKIFSGRGHPPPELSSEEQVIAYVQKNPGAIGYITMGAKPANVLLVEVVP